jgi:integrase/recombinase XerC
MVADTYTEWLLAQGLTDKTVSIYRGKLDRAETLATGQGWDLQQLTPSQAAELANSFPYTTSTRRQLRTALVHYWQLHDVVGPARAIRVPPKPLGHYRGLESDEARLLAKTARGWWPEGGAVLLGLYLALRREEIAKLRWDSFDRDLEWVTIMGKGSRSRTLPVHPSLADQLRAHVSAYVYVFPGAKGRAYCHPATVWTWVETVSVAAGVRVTRPHQLRHTCLATMNDHTRDLRTTQEFAGHSRPETTAIYTRTTGERLCEAVASLDYLD